MPTSARLRTPVAGGGHCPCRRCVRATAARAAAASAGCHRAGCPPMPLCRRGSRPAAPPAGSRRRGARPDRRASFPPTARSCPVAPRSGCLPREPAAPPLPGHDREHRRDAREIELLVDPIVEQRADDRDQQRQRQRSARDHDQISFRSQVRRGTDARYFAPVFREVGKMNRSLISGFSTRIACRSVATRQ